MNLSLTHPRSHPTVTSHPPFPYGSELEIDSGVTLQPKPCESVPPLDHTSQYDTRPFDQEPTFIMEGSAHSPTTHLAPTNYSPRNDAFSDPLAPPAVPVSFVYPAWYAPGNNIGAASLHSVPSFTSGVEHDTFLSMIVSGPSNGQAVPATLQPKHITQWHQITLDAVVNGPRTFVPQIVYQPQYHGDQQRYVTQATLHNPIVFLTRNSPEWGVSIQRLLSNELVQLIEGNAPAFASCGRSIGIRLHWPGYQQFHKQVSAKDYTRDQCVISKARLARLVAKHVKIFMDTVSGQAMEVGSDARWRIGPFHIKPDDIILVSLHHVSQGSWQPQLRLRGTIGTIAVLGLWGYNHA